MILGIDEVGRGCWAGPLVVGAVILPKKYDLSGLDDSKKLSRKRRTELNSKIQTVAVATGLGWVSAPEIDDIGLSKALILASKRATEQLIRSKKGIENQISQIYIDGQDNFLKGTKFDQLVRVLPKADSLIPAVSAASIIAKVARDDYMTEQSTLYPSYGFYNHVGYGTKEHRWAIENLGLTPLHRKSFRPINIIATKGFSMDIASVGSVTDTNQVEVLPRTLTSKSVGNRAEDSVVNYLLSKGYSILSRNWRTRYCEIDIVAEKSSIRFFIEVKYRSSGGQGGGVAVITKSKIKHLIFAADIYNAHNQTKFGYQIVVADVTGDLNKKPTIKLFNLN